MSLESQYHHEPVLLREVTEHLVTDPGGVYLDATVGLGGHAKAVLEKLGPSGCFLGVDWDPEVLRIAKARIGENGRVRFAEGNFRNLGAILEREGYLQLTGALFDLGINSLHFDKASRGFSFQHDGPLDMRLSPENPLKASTIINEWPLDQLVLIFKEYGEERHAFKIARRIVERREQGPFQTTWELKNLIERIMPRARTHPATKVFMALRIVVNQELENMTRGIEDAAKHLALGGRIAVISFHSLEDRIMKQVFRQFVEEGDFAWVVKKPIRPSRDEVLFNARSRSAKLRVIERVKEHDFSA